MDEIIKDQLDAVRYQKLMGRASLLERPVSGSGKGSPAWLPNNEYEDDSYVTDEMLEDLRIKADNE